jgi:nitroimidazol reductase NimA-like FMN-containing flavoprotein (pyridoxamine 5'-phosphate oxidase superfamily)
MYTLPDYEPPDKIGKLTDDEVDAFLAQPWKTRLATITPQNTPYIVPLWYQFDATQRVFYIVARGRSKYVQHILHNPAVALQIADDAHLENTRVMIEGTAKILVGPVPPDENPELQEIVLAMSRRYMGEEGPAYAKHTISQPRYLIRITPDRWTTWTGRAWAPRYRKD